MQLFRDEGQNDLADWFEENIELCLTVSNTDSHIKKRLRSSNMMENVNKQLKRRSRVIGIFPSEKSLLRLVCCLLMEISEQWESSNAYISPEKSQKFIKKVINSTQPN